MRQILGFVLVTGMIVSTGLAQDTSVAPPGSAPQAAPRVNWGGLDGVLWDNGAPDGVNGYSNGTEAVFGTRRTLLFDFVVPTGEAWDVGALRWRHIWNGDPPGSGTGLEIRFHDDAGDMPGAAITDWLSATSYAEEATGNTFFSRPEAESVADFPIQSFTEGRYWADATIVGFDNNFWLTSPVIENECWVDYSEFGGLQPGSDIFGGSADINGQLLTEGGGGGGLYSLTLSGSCRSQVTVQWDNATPNVRQAVVFGFVLGSTDIPPGNPCAGTTLRLEGNVHQIGGRFINTGNGSGSVTGRGNLLACDGILQLVEGGTCNTSNTVQIPN